jgi:EF-hand domain pair
MNTLQSSITAVVGLSRVVCIRCTSRSTQSECTLRTCCCVLKAFDHFDPAKKGHISVEDLMRCFGSDEEARKILGELDFDGNGVITFEGKKIFTIIIH